MWLYGPKAKFRPKKILFVGLTLWREPNYFKKAVQINLGHMNVNRYLPFCLARVRTVKRTATLPALTGLLLQGQECQECYRIHSVCSQLQDGLAGYLQDHRQNTPDKAALWGWADAALRILLWVEGWTNGPASWTCVRPCYRGKHFPIITSTLKAQKGLPMWTLLGWNC